MPDYYSILGLAPGRYSHTVVRRRFLEERRRLLAALDDAGAYDRACSDLEALHIAYAALRDPRRQASYQNARLNDADGVSVLRQQIAASLEDGLLRHSRREDILASGRQIGLSDFQVHLLIAQVQFGDERIQPAPPAHEPLADDAARRFGLRFAAAGVLALAMFFAMLSWVRP